MSYRSTPNPKNAIASLEWSGYLSEILRWHPHSARRKHWDATAMPSKSTTLRKLCAGIGQRVPGMPNDILL